MRRQERQKQQRSRDELADDIFARLVRILAEARRRQQALTKRHGVTMLQSTAIHVLRDGGPLNITQLADRLHLNQSTVSGLVDRMERDGLVRRLQSSRDRRSVQLRLTERADQLADAVPVSPADFFKHLLGTLSPNEIRSVASMLEKVESAMFRELAKLDERAKRRARRRAS